MLRVIPDLCIHKYRYRHQAEGGSWKRMRLTLILNLSLLTDADDHDGRSEHLLCSAHRSSFHTSQSSFPVRGTSVL